MEVEIMRELRTKTLIILTIVLLLTASLGIPIPSALAKGKPTPLTASVTINGGYIFASDGDVVYTNGNGSIVTIDQPDPWPLVQYGDYGLDLITTQSNRSVNFDFLTAEKYNSCTPPETTPPLKTSGPYDIELEVVPFRCRRSMCMCINMHSMSIGETLRCKVFIVLYTTEGEYLGHLNAAWLSCIQITRFAEHEWHVYSPNDSDFTTTYNRWFNYLTRNPDGTWNISCWWYAITFDMVVTEASS